MISQHQAVAGATNRVAPNRRKAARLFNQDKYRLRVLIEDVFGAEERRVHQLRCRGHPDGQPPAVHQGDGHSLERAGARPVRAGQQAEGSNPILWRTAGTRRMRLTSPLARIRACSVASSEMAAWPVKAREGKLAKTDENYAPISCSGFHADFLSCHVICRADFGGSPQTRTRLLVWKIGCSKCTSSGLTGFQTRSYPGASPQSADQAQAGI